jgi:hypothetical protein
MSPTWIAAALYTLIVGALGLIVWWEYRRIKKRPVSDRQSEKDLDSRL